ncbi:phosphotyrosine protein phosphatase [Stenotrophomonas maltophilia]|nr:phosphotyrosine protein phosphatase [Stenotrophomonas maltophilia]
MTRHVLFLCSQNRLRSPTAEQVFADWPGVETASAGLLADADELLGPELLEWADLVFVMERAHRTRLSARFAPSLNGKRVVCLDIPDDYDYMDPVLVELLKRKVSPHLR